MSPRPVDSDRFAALLGDDVAKEFVARVCDAPDDASELSRAQQLTVDSFFSVLGADFKNAAANEREMDGLAMFLWFAMTLQIGPSDPGVRRFMRFAGISHIAPKSDDDAGPWRLWESAQSAARVVHKFLRLSARLF